eukprot:Sspe_Gene.100875::Locus_75526_Transcript_1_1_Confidence_1.000_Length_1889::g.100875::m.100875
MSNHGEKGSGGETAQKVDCGMRLRHDGVLGLRYMCDWRTVLWVAIYHALTVYTWCTWYQTGWALRVALLLACALFSFFGATITHNAIHVPVFTKPWMNSVFQVLLSLTYGWPVSALVPGHNLSHHKFTNTDKDTMRPDRMRYRINLFNYLMFPITTARAIASHDASYMMHQRKHSRPIWRQYVREAVVFYPLQAALAFASFDRWFWVIFLPQLYAKYQIIAMNILQHDGCPEQEKDPYNNARNFTGWTINFLTFNNGYHTIHHANPGWHWSRLKYEHDRLIKPHIHPNLDQDNILTYFWKAHVWPGKRLWYDGTEYVLPPERPDKEWYTGTAETYSDAK